MTTEGTLLTADDLLRLPDDGQRHELVRGELRTMPPAGGEHGLIAGRAFRRIANFVEDEELGFVFAAETGFRIFLNPDTVRAPDVAFVAVDRFPDGRIPARFPELAPDLVVEVVSPYDSADNVDEKMADWIDAGVRMAIAVFPKGRRALVWRSRSDIRALKEQDLIDGGDVLPGFRCQVSELFQR